MDTWHLKINNEHIFVDTNVMLSVPKPVEPAIVGYVKGESCGGKRHADCVLLDLMRNRSLLECEYKLAEVHTSLESSDKYTAIADALVANKVALVGRPRMISLHAIRLDDDAKEWQACSEKMVRLAHGGFPKDLRVIRLCCNQIKELPPTLFMLGNLRSLYLARNHIKRVPNDIGCLKRLRVLDLSANMLQTLPSAIGGCCELRELILMHNQLSEVPRELGECSKLKVLDVRYNINIKYLPYTLFSKKSHLRVDTEGCSLVQNADDLWKLCKDMTLKAPCPSLKELCLLGGRLQGNRCDKCLRKCNAPLRFRGVTKDTLPLIMRVCAVCE